MAGESNTNVQQVAGYAEALLSSLTLNTIVPGLMLAGMALMFVWVLFKAQRRTSVNEHFDASQFLRDESDKLSSMRLFAFIAVSIHTWVIAVETMNARITPDMMVIYSVTWSSSLVLKEAVSKWNGSLPWAKGA